MSPLSPHPHLRSATCSSQQHLTNCFHTLSAFAPLYLSSPEASFVVSDVTRPTRCPNQSPFYSSASATYVAAQWPKASSAPSPKIQNTPLKSAQSTPAEQQPTTKATHPTRERWTLWRRTTLRTMTTLRDEYVSSRSLLLCVLGDKRR